MAIPQMYALDLSSYTWHAVKKDAGELWPPARALVQHSFVAVSATSLILTSGLCGRIYFGGKKYTANCSFAQALVNPTTMIVRMCTMQSKGSGKRFLLDKLQNAVFSKI